MNIELNTDPTPLHVNEDGVILVTGTRVPLDTLVMAFDEGASPEEMVQQYPTVTLADAYAAIAWYLRHRPEVEEYLQGRRTVAEQVQREVEARNPPAGIRERLLARLKAKEA